MFRFSVNESENDRVNCAYNACNYHVACQVRADIYTGVRYECGEAYHVQPYVFYTTAQKERCEYRQGKSVARV